MGIQNRIAADLSSHVLNGESIYHIDREIDDELARFSNCSDAPFFLGKIYFWSGDIGQTRKSFETMSLAGKDGLVKSWLLAQNINGSSSHESFRVENALRLYIDLYPNSGEGYMHMGILSRNRKDYLAARYFYKIAMQHDPRVSSRAYFFIGQTYMMSDQAIDGIAPLRQSLFLDLESRSLHITERITAYYWIGIGYLWQSDLQNAEAYLRRANLLSEETSMKVDWLLCENNLSLGQVLRLQGRVVESAVVFQQVIEQCATRPQNVSAALSELAKISK